MMQQNNNNSTSHILLHNQLSLIDQALVHLIVTTDSANPYARLASIEELIAKQDANLAFYQSLMKLRYFDDITGEIIKCENYLDARKHLKLKLDENKKYMEDLQTRPRYEKYLILKYQLLCSCYPYIGMLPPMENIQDKSLLTAPRPAPVRKPAPILDNPVIEQDGDSYRVQKPFNNQKFDNSPTVADDEDANYEYEN